MRTGFITNSIGKSTLGLLIAFLFLSAFSFAQEIQVKGVVKGKFEDVVETLPDANVYLKGTNVGTTTNRKGEFTFPRKLKVGDILVFSYLGYKKKEVTLRPTSTYISVILEEDGNVLLGAPNSNKRYKSKKRKD